MSPKAGLFTELKRRNVFRVAAAYAVVAWLLVQAGDIMLTNFGAPDWVFKTIVAVLIIGFPLALFLAWAYELTPDGVARTPGPAGPQPDAPSSRWPDYLLVAALLAVGAIMLIRGGQDRDPGTPDPVQAPVVDASGPIQELGIEAAAGNTLAVLPFTNFSPDAENEYFADGVAEELLRILGRIEGLEVASRTSSFSFKQTSIPVPEIARQLGVAHLLEGSVRRHGTRVRITAQLVEAESDRHLWSDSYDRELADIFTVQEEIARAIARALEDTLGLRTVEVTAPTRDLSAYEDFLRGRQLFHQRDAGLIEARARLEAAVERDPQFALAWATLAAVYQVSPDYYEFSQAEAMQLADQAADRARRLDDSLALPYAVLGRVRMMQDGQRIIGYELMEEAVERDPGDSTSLLWLGIHHLEAGHLERAQTVLEQALRVDPLSGIVQGWYGTVRGARGDLDAARRYLLRAAESGGWHAGLYRLCFVAMAEGDVGQTIEYLERVLSQHSQLALVQTGIIGATIDALKDPALKGALYERVVEHGVDRRGGTPMLLLLGMQDQALDLELKESIANRTGLFEYGWWPGQRSLMSRPRFLEAAEHRGYVDYWEQYGYPDGCRRVKDPEPRLECTL